LKQSEPPSRRESKTKCEKGNGLRLDRLSEEEFANISAIRRSVPKKTRQAKTKKEKKMKQRKRKRPRVKEIHPHALASPSVRRLISR